MPGAVALEGRQALGPSVAVPPSLEPLEGPRLGLRGDMERLRLDRKGSGQLSAVRKAVFKRLHGPQFPHLQNVN